MLLDFQLMVTEDSMKTGGSAAILLQLLTTHSGRLYFRNLISLLVLPTQHSVLSIIKKFFQYGVTLNLKLILGVQHHRF